MKKILKLTYISILFIGLSSCLDMINPNNYNPEGKVKMKRVKVDSLYAIEIPSYMKKTTILNDDAKLQYMNAYKETYTIIIHEPIKTLEETFTEMGDYNKKLTADKNYKNIQLDFIKETLTKVKMYDPEYLTINGLNASLIKVEGIIEGIHIFYQLGFIEGQENVFMIMTWTEKNKKNRYRYTFQKIIESFALLK